MELERNTKTSRSTTWAVNDADSRADGEEAQMRNLLFHHLCILVCSYSCCLRNQLLLEAIMYIFFCQKKC